MECKKCKITIEENKKYGSGIFCSKKCQVRFAFESKKDKIVKKAKESNTLKRFIFIKNCNKCNKKFEVERGYNKNNSIHIFKNEKNFCSRSCANSRGPRTEEFKEKIRLKLEKEKLEKECLQCHKIFKIGYNKRLQSFCSLYCRYKYPVSLETRKKLSLLVNKRISDGNHKGWQSRNKISYPEKFFMKVLTNNGLSFQHNFPINQKNLGLDSSYSYFLDFYFENIKLDLEIDGRQHKNRIQHDKKRDELLKNKGIIVYRIKWKDINNDSGKKYMRNEINKFLSYYNSICKNSHA